MVSDSTCASCCPPISFSHRPSLHSDCLQPKIMTDKHASGHFPRCKLGFVYVPLWSVSKNSLLGQSKISFLLGGDSFRLPFKTTLLGAFSTFLRTTPQKRSFGYIQRPYHIIKGALCFGACSASLRPPATLGSGTAAGPKTTWHRPIYPLRICIDVRG